MQLSTRNVLTFFAITLAAVAAFVAIASLAPTEARAADADPCLTEKGSTQCFARQSEVQWLCRDENSCTPTVNRIDRLCQDHPGRGICDLSESDKRMLACDRPRRDALYSCSLEGPKGGRRLWS